MCREIATTTECGGGGRRRRWIPTTVAGIAVVAAGLSETGIVVGIVWIADVVVIDIVVFIGVAKVAKVAVTKAADSSSSIAIDRSLSLMFRQHITGLHGGGGNMGAAMVMKMTMVMVVGVGVVRGHSGWDTLLL